MNLNSIYTKRNGIGILIISRPSINNNFRTNAIISVNKPDDPEVQNHMPKRQLNYNNTYPLVTFVSNITIKSYNIMNINILIMDTSITLLKLILINDQITSKRVTHPHYPNLDLNNQVGYQH